ncbi:MAG: phosphodiester glycosidase family protein [Chthoniobacterales bacterium]
MKICLVVLFTGLLTLPALAEWKAESLKTPIHFSSGAQLVEASLFQDNKTVHLTAFIFEERNYEFRVVDNASKSSTLMSGMEATSASAGVNGGYFQEDFTPVGLLVENGKRLHEFQTAKLLSGVFWVQGNGKPEILSAQTFSSRDRKPLQAIQCGPRLVQEGKATVGLNAVRSARRTIIATDGHGKWALLTLSTGTLADAAEILTVSGLFNGLSISSALNFDGGSSTGLWVKKEPKAFYVMPYANVRDYLAVFPKH